MGDFAGHPFRGNQWTGGYSVPDRSEDPAPGKDYYYHATPAKNLASIADSALKPPAGTQNPVSLAPHLESAHTWGGLIGGQENALLRVRRKYVKGVEIADEEDTGVPYDPMDDGAEVATYRHVQPQYLEVYHEGKWVSLKDHVDWKRNPPKQGR